ncbi:hypothetical protein AVEN_92325-1 [Araneus ventricosus]|uniref:Uncharacterized protein n=1 Tax=Araneus ventricosus TaxID=182803 RepID=A0A4Y2AME4_ARAVE|nr:hypothetical protein AVEN_92325-1 [Araneus ventricosus]
MTASSFLPTSLVPNSTQPLRFTSIFRSPPARSVVRRRPKPDSRWKCSDNEENLLRGGCRDETADDLEENETESVGSSPE